MREDPLTHGLEAVKKSDCRGGALWPPWGNHKGCPYDAPLHRDFFTASCAVDYILSPALRAVEVSRHETTPGNQLWLLPLLQGSDPQNEPRVPRPLDGAKDSRVQQP